MRTTSIVHIGFHKTGTTWFQECVYPRVKNFRYVPRARVQAALLEPTAFAFDAARAARELGGADAPLLLCEENLSGYPHSGGLQGFLTRVLAERIRAALPSARIVMFVRRQPEMIAACYQQYVRAGGTHSAQRYLWPSDWLRGAEAQAFKTPRFSFDHFDYDRLVAHYVALFGRENVHVFPYEEIQRDAAAFLARFAAELGLELDSATVPTGKQNASYSRAVAMLARALNRFTDRTVADKRHWLHVPRWYSVRRLLVESLNKTGLFGQRAAPEVLLGDGTVAWIRQRFWESNRALAKLVAHFAPRLVVGIGRFAADRIASCVRRSQIGFSPRKGDEPHRRIFSRGDDCLAADLACCAEKQYFHIADAAMAAGSSIVAGGARRNRTADLLNAIQALSQLSYSPEFSVRPPIGTAATLSVRFERAEPSRRPAVPQGQSGSRQASSSSPPETMPVMSSSSSSSSSRRVSSSSSSRSISRSSISPSSSSAASSSRPGLRFDFGAFCSFSAASSETSAAGLAAGVSTSLASSSRRGLRGFNNASGTNSWSHFGQCAGCLFRS